MGCGKRDRPHGRPIRNIFRKAEAHLELSLARTARRASIRASAAKRRLGKMWGWWNKWVMEDPEKVEIQNVFYSLDFTAETNPQESWTLDLREEGWRKKGFPLVREGWVRDQLSRFNTHKSMGPDEMYPWVLRELVDVAKSLSIIFEKPWRAGEASS